MADSGLPPTGELTRSMRLVQRFQEGDREALDELFDRYYERVRRIARIRVGPWLGGLTESDDLVQNTFAVAFQKIGEIELRDHASIIQYLSRLLETQIRGAAEYFGAQKRDPARVLPLADDAEDTIPVGKEPQPLDHLVSRELKELYDDCVQSLPGDQREVVVLKEYATATWPEIQRALGRPTVHAAQELYCRAQLKLAECLRRKIR